MRKVRRARGTLAAAAPAAYGQAPADPRSDAVRPPPAAGKAEAPNAGREAARRSTLDDLFARLEAAADADEAKGVAGLIDRRFARSGSDTADLLMSRAGEALTAKDAALAVELLDRVTQLTPNWADGWSRRAAAFFQLDDPGGALADIRQALAREPRHYNSWAALGHIAMSTGDKKQALAAYRRALKLHPHLDGIRTMVDRLAPDVDGRDL